MQEYFRQFARVAAMAAGSAWAFWIAVAIVLIWGVTGPIFRYSDTWQLVINTGTTIITFLMVFLIQNAQNRDGKAVQLKLDEIIRALKNARNELIDLEELSDEQLTRLQQEFTRLRAKCDSEQPHAPLLHHREDPAATESPT
ncbi:MAG TPA: low affinity iron permease family protein [Planctomycetaceae bacterium]|nr:low affinity iron permease family protein [Planctomycetaceae bacterium]